MGVEEENIIRFIIEYRRHTKFKTKSDFYGKRQNVWDYSEKLTLCKKDGTLEYVRNIDNDCRAVYKYKAKDDVLNLLNDFEDFLSDIPLNSPVSLPCDIINDPDNEKSYKITIDFESGAQRIFEGYFDKYGLLPGFFRFAEDINDFLEFYDFSEMLNPNIYGGKRRRRSDYIFLSVEFYSGGKSYYYLTDDEKISIGDSVVVPAGEDNRRTVAKVVNIEYYSKFNAPWPMEKTKRVLRKYMGCDLGSSLIVAPGFWQDSVRDRKNQLALDKSESALSAAYADAHNKVGFLLNKLSEEDYGLETEENFREWFSFEEELGGIIFDIMKFESNDKFDGQKYYNDAVKIFMRRNGFNDSGGWWLK